jgi:hypothetical protein
MNRQVEMNRVELLNGLAGQLNPAHEKHLQPVSDQLLPDLRRTQLFQRRRDALLRQEGERVKFSLNRNSAKFYDKAYSEIGSVLRAAETTIITVGDFRAYRSREGGE